MFGNSTDKSDLTADPKKLKKGKERQQGFENGETMGSNKVMNKDHQQNVDKGDTAAGSNKLKKGKERQQDVDDNGPKSSMKSKTRDIGQKVGNTWRAFMNKDAVGPSLPYVPEPANTEDPPDYQYPQQTSSPPPQPSRLPPQISVGFQSAPVSSPSGAPPPFSETPTSGAVTMEMAPSRARGKSPRSGASFDWSSDLDARSVTPTAESYRRPSSALPERPIAGRETGTASSSASPLGKDLTDEKMDQKPHEPIQSREIFVAVMGATGVGKSTFIEWCCDDTEDKPLIGDDLRSCTQKVNTYPCHYDRNTTIYLIDTPGFDDTERSDTDVLKEVASFLSSSYSDDRKLNGIIYFHRITDRRMAGSAIRNLELFKKLCGAEALNHVILATTMWESVNEADGEKRVKQLESTPEFWGTMLTYGSMVKRHYNSRESAMELLDHFAASDMGNTKVVLDIQSQMVDRGMELSETSAGVLVESQLAQYRTKFEQEISRLRDETKIALEKKDDETAQRLNAEKARMDKRVREIQEESDRLRQKVEGMAAEQKDALNRVMARSRSRMTEGLRPRRLSKRPEEDETSTGSMTDTDSVVPSDIAETEAELPEQDLSGPDLSLTLLGKRYYLKGMKTDKWDMGHPALTLPIERHMNWREDNQFVEFGASGSWFQHYHDSKKKECRNRVSPNMSQFYPRWKSGYSRLDTCPECVSLGLHGAYFVRLKSGEMYFSLPVDIEEALGDVRKLRQFWLGYNNSYYGVMESGQARWNFHGHYGLLQNLLQRVPDHWRIHRLCLDIGCRDEWIVVWTNRKYAYNLCDDCTVQHLSIELPRWGRENGLDLVE